MQRRAEASSSKTKQNNSKASAHCLIYSEVGHDAVLCGKEGRHLLWFWSSVVSILTYYLCPNSFCQNLNENSLSCAICISYDI